MVLRPARNEIEGIAALFQDFDDIAGHKIQPPRQFSELISGSLIRQVARSIIGIRHISGRRPADIFTADCKIGVAGYDVINIGYTDVHIVIDGGNRLDFSPLLRRSGTHSPNWAVCASAYK